MMQAVQEIRSVDPGIGGYKLWLMLCNVFGREWMPGRDAFLAVLRRHKLLRMAIAQTGKDDLEGLIHHSDRGVQYCCDMYVEELQKHRIAISMTEDYKPTDNALAERVNATVKTERVYVQPRRFKDLEDAQSQISEFVDFYNTRRPHMSIGMQTPEQAHAQTGEQRKCWKTKTFRHKSTQDKEKSLSLPPV